MKVTEEALKELEALLREEYPNKKFTQEQLLEIATRLLRAVELVYRSIPQEKVRKFHYFDN